jgi:hypothetical protein
VQAHDVRRLGLASEGARGFAADISAGVRAVAREWGWETVTVDDAAGEAAVETVLAVGNVSLFPDLLGRPRGARRILWHGEVLPRRTEESGGVVHRMLPTGRWLDVAAQVLPALAERDVYVRLREQAAMAREPIANLRALRRWAVAFDRIVIDSHDRAEAALASGLAVDVVPFGYHAAFAGQLRTPAEKSVPIISLAHSVGKVGRRQRLLSMIEANLAQAGIPLARISADTYGDRRNALLDPARIVVDVHRLPGNHPGFRFIVATAAGAALVSEPLASPAPLVPGVHYIEADAHEMAEVLRALLGDEPWRRRIVDAAQELLASTLSMERVLPRVLGLPVA